MAPLQIRTEVQVMFFDTDCGGVVSNIAYLRFIEIARTSSGNWSRPHRDDRKKQTYPVVKCAPKLIIAAQPNSVIGW